MSNTARMARQLKAVNDEWKTDPFGKALEKLAEINREMAQEAADQVEISRSLREDFERIFGGEK